MSFLKESRTILTHHKKSFTLSLDTNLHIQNLIKNMQTIFIQPAHPSKEDGEYYSTLCMWCIEKDLEEQERQIFLRKEKSFEEQIISQKISTI